MRLSAKWRDAWSTIAPVADSRRVERIALDGDLFDVIRMGRGEPIVLVPGLAGGWKLLAPLARRLAREFEVVLYSLRGDRARGRSGLSEARRRHADVGGHAADLAALIGRLGMERPAVLGVSFLLMSTAGYLIGSIALMAGTMALARVKLVTLVVTAVAAPLVLWFLFVHLLATPLP